MQINQDVIYANLQMRSGKFLQALDTLNKAYDISLQTNGDFAIPTQRVRVLLAECLFRTGELKKAEVQLREIVKSARISLFPLKIVAHDHYLLGLIAHHDGRNPEAERRFRKALSMWQDSSTAANMIIPEQSNITYALADVPPTEEYEICVAKLGDVEFKLKDFENAQKCYTAATRYFGLETGDLKEFDKAVAPGQDLVAAGINRAIAYDRLAQVELELRHRAAVQANMQTSVDWIKRCAVGRNLALEGLVRKDYADTMWRLGDYIQAAREQYLALNIFSRAQ